MMRRRKNLKRKKNLRKNIMKLLSRNLSHASFISGITVMRMELIGGDRLPR